jgi:hypothetical protein
MTDNQVLSAEDQCQTLIYSHHKTMRQAVTAHAGPEISIPLQYHVSPQVMDALIALATSGEIEIGGVINDNGKPRMLKKVKLFPGEVTIRERSPWSSKKKETPLSQEWE